MAALLFVLLLTFIKMTIYFIAPFFVALALRVNIKFTDIFTIITLASIVTLVATFVPIPEPVVVLSFSSI